MGNCRSADANACLHQFWIIWYLQIPAFFKITSLNKLKQLFLNQKSQFFEKYWLNLSQNYHFKRLNIKRNSLDTFEAFYKDNYKILLNVAVKMLHDIEAAKDVVQEVFTYYYLKLENGHVIEFNRSWIFKAVINNCIDEVKKLNRKIDLNHVTIEESTNENAIKRDRKEIVQLALSKLTLNEKQLAVLYSEGFSYKEISDITGIKNTSVGKMLSRTLLKLKEELKKLDYEMFE